MFVFTFHWWRISPGIYKISSKGYVVHFIFLILHFGDFLSVHAVHHGRGFHCHVAFMASNSPVRSLRFTGSGEVLAVGYQNGQVYFPCLWNFTIYLKLVITRCY
jgi:hypothetical protein